MLLECLAAVGAVTMGAGGIALARNLAAIVVRPPRIKRSQFAGVVVVGIALAALSTQVWYPYERCIRVIGFPFASRCFDQQLMYDGPDFDQRTPFPMLMIAADVAFWFLVPQLWLRSVRRPGQTSAHTERRSIDVTDYVLMPLTVLATAVYVPIGWLLANVIGGPNYGEPVTILQQRLLFFVFPTAMLGAAGMATAWAIRRGLTTQGRVVWALLVAASVLGLPFAGLLAMLSLFALSVGVP